MPKRQCLKIGASRSMLMAAICLASEIPAMCWLAPVMPMGRYSPGATSFPVCPTCQARGTQPARQVRRELLAVGIVREEDGGRTRTRLREGGEALLGLVVFDLNRPHRAAEALRGAGQALRGAVGGEQHDDDVAHMACKRCRASSSTVTNSHCVSLFGIDSSSTSY